MEKIKLGNTGLMISPIVFGGNVFGWTIDLKKSFDILNAYVDAGFEAVDTADVYSRWKPGNSGGESETIIGKWMNEKKNRKDIVIATKVGSDMGGGKKGLKKEYIIKAAEASLKRLQTDYIDLYQTHFDDESVLVEETLSAYDDLVREGKVRFIGASNISVDRLKESFAASAEKGYPSYETLQPHYNLYEREIFENGLEPVCIGHGLGVIPYYSLAGGFLTGKYRSKSDLEKSPRGAGAEKYLDDRGKAILEVLDELAKEYNTSQATLALAWLIHRPSVSAPIVSATDLLQLGSIIQAPQIEIGADAIGKLNSASAW